MSNKTEILSAKIEKSSTIRCRPMNDGSTLWFTLKNRWLDCRPIKENSLGVNENFLAKSNSLIDTKTKTL